MHRKQLNYNVEDVNDAFQFSTSPNQIGYNSYGTHNVVNSHGETITLPYLQLFQYSLLNLRGKNICNIV